MAIALHCSRRALSSRYICNWLSPWLVALLSVINERDESDACALGPLRSLSDDAGHTRTLARSLAHRWSFYCALLVFAVVAKSHSEREWCILAPLQLAGSPCAQVVVAQHEPIERWFVHGLGGHLSPAHASAVLPSLSAFLLRFFHQFRTQRDRT
jgi:hypothetical protein